MANWRWSVFLAAMALLAVAVSAGRTFDTDLAAEFDGSTTFVVELEDPAPQDAFSYASEQVSRSFTAVLDFFEWIGRLEVQFISKIIDFFSFRPAFFTERQGGTEPLGVLHEPPTIHQVGGAHNSILHMYHRAVEDGISEYRSIVEALKDEGTCDGPSNVELHLQLLRDVTAQRMKELLCRTHSPMCEPRKVNKHASAMVEVAWRKENVCPLQVVKWHTRFNNENQCTVEQSMGIREIVDLGHGLKDHLLQYWGPYEPTHVLDAAYHRLEAFCENNDTPLCSLRKDNQALLRRLLHVALRPHDNTHRRSATMVKPPCALRRAMHFFRRGAARTFQVEIFFGPGVDLTTVLNDLRHDPFDFEEIDRRRMVIMGGYSPSVQGEFQRMVNMKKIPALAKYGEAAGNNAMVASM